MDLTELKAGIRASWSLGNYPELARELEPAAQALVDGCAISAGQEVLDVAAGTGNVAVLAAREGADVVASDLTPALLDQGRARAAEEGLDIEWVEADAEDLPFDSARFDCVTSSFGVMFAPRPEVAAGEMFRVVKPGGAVGVASWTPDGFSGQLFSRQGKYAPRGYEDLPDPVEWGEEETVRRRFEGLAARLSAEKKSVRFAFDSTEQMWEFFRQNAGPLVAAEKAMPPDAFAAMRTDVLDLMREWGGGSGDGPVAIDSEYLLVVARKRG